MGNIGIMKQAQLNALLKSFPSNARVERGDIVVGVFAPTGEQVLSAALVAPGRWHVRAKPGLVVPA